MSLSLFLVVLGSNLLVAGAVSLFTLGRIKSLEWELHQVEWAYDALDEKVRRIRQHVSEPVPDQWAAYNEGTQDAYNSVLDILDR